MNHLVVLPILIPVVAAAILLLLPSLSQGKRRGVSIASAGLFLLCSALLLHRIWAGDILVYRLGNWPAQYGIALMADRLSATMLALTGLLALAGLLHSTAGTDETEPKFYVFYQMQIAGIAIAFLTNDLFNLFVAFEILLLASYALTVAGGGRERTRAGIAYVVLNLVGSSLFLIGLGLLYGALGTLNMADAAAVLPGLPAENLPLARLALMLIALVFLLKSALLPMSFWLPHVYSVAPVAAAVLFAVLTKVGIYALMRVSTLVLPAHALTAGLLEPWLRWLALGTIALGAIGVLAARRLSVLVANLVLISSGTLLFAASERSEQALAAMAYYMPQSTLVAAGLFLVSGMIADRCGTTGDALRPTPEFQNMRSLGVVFGLLAVAVSGLPPLSGFLGKVMLMRAIPAEGIGAVYWAALLISGFAVALMLAKVAGMLFWEVVPSDVLPAPLRSGGASFLALGLLLAAILAFTVLARPLSHHAFETAQQLLARQALIDAVLGSGATQREKRP